MLKTPKGAVNTLFDLSDFPLKDFFLEESPWTILEQLEMCFGKVELGKIKSPLPSSVHLINADQITIESDVDIAPNVCIEGPSFIEKKARLGFGAYIRPFSYISYGALVGHCTEVKHSILLKNAKAPHFNYVGDSILGANVNLGAGAVCANKRFDSKPITVVYKGRKIPTLMKKLGAILGDGVQVGCSCVLNPGTILEKYAVLSTKGVRFPRQKSQALFKER